MNRPLTPSLSPSDGERVAGGRVRGWFMVPMDAEKRKGISHELGWGEIPSSPNFPAWGKIRARRSFAPPFVAPLRDSGIMFAPHEPGEHPTPLRHAQHPEARPHRMMAAASY